MFSNQAKPHVKSKDRGVTATSELCTKIVLEEKQDKKKLLNSRKAPTNSNQSQNDQWFQHTALADIPDPHVV